MAALVQALCAARVAPAAAASCRQKHHATSFNAVTRHSTGRVSIKPASAVSRVSLLSARGAQTLRVRAAADAPADATPAEPVGDKVQEVKEEVKEETKEVVKEAKEEGKEVVKNAEAAVKEVAKKKVKEEPVPFVPPPLNPNTPSPIFGGSTGGLLRKVGRCTG
jgi:hypothetical protein